MDRTVVTAVIVSALVLPIAPPPGVLASQAAQVMSPPDRPDAVALETGPIGHLFALVSRRLDLSRDVARAKWNSRAPIEDLAREQSVIDDVVARAGSFGVRPDVAAAFFRAQIEASKAVQRALHARWTLERAAPFDPAPSIDAVRPALDSLTIELLRALAAALPGLATPAGERQLQRHIDAHLAPRPDDRDAVRIATAPLARNNR